MKNTIKALLFWGAAIATGKFIYHGWCNILGIQPQPTPSIISIHKHYECPEVKTENEEVKDETKENG